MNIGKKFEEDIKKSIPPYALLYRLPDAAQSFGNSTATRFSSKNPFDFLIWDSQRHWLHAVEAKTVAGKSISFERSKEDSGEIHYHQVEGLLVWSTYDGVSGGFLIKFRMDGKEEPQTIYLPINEFKRLERAILKKSFNLTDLSTFNIGYVVVPQRKLRTNYRYDIDFLLSNINK